MSHTTETPASTAPGAAWFKTTHWTAVVQAGSTESKEAYEGLGMLCRAYWHPLYTYVRRLGHSPEDAQDLVQGFFARVVEKGYIQAADPEKGRFRSFLLTALKRYMANEWDRANRQKRGGGQELVSLDAKDTENHYRAEPADSMTPERAFEKRWATTLLELVLEQLKADYASTGKAEVFREIEGCLSGDTGNRSHAEIGEKLGMTEGAVKVAVHRLRQRYRELLRLEIANTVADPETINDEIRHLFAALE